MTECHSVTAEGNAKAIVEGNVVEGNVTAEGIRTEGTERHGQNVVTAEGKGT